jgi:hypothetical protein
MNISAIGCSYLNSLPQHMLITFRTIQNYQYVFHFTPQFKIYIDIIFSVVGKLKSSENQTDLDQLRVYTCY